MVFPPSNSAMANRMLSWKTRSLVAFMMRSMTRSDAPSRSRWHCTSISDISALLKPPEVIQTHKTYHKHITNVPRRYNEKLTHLTGSWLVRLVLGQSYWRRSDSLSSHHSWSHSNDWRAAAEGPPPVMSVRVCFSFFGIFFFAIVALACSPHGCKTLFLRTKCIISAIQINRINIKGIIVVEPGQLRGTGVWLKSRVRWC